MNVTDLYDGFAERYDLIPDSLGNYSPVMEEFFRRVFAEHNVRSILDCACGTGRHLMLFYDLGYQVWGSDISKAMLTQAQENFSHQGYDIPLLLADYRDLPQNFQRNFDAITCLGSIGYMTDNDEFLRAFKSMYTVLRTGGTLILTTMLTDKSWDEKPRFKLGNNTADVSRLFVMDYYKHKVGYSILDIFHSQKVKELKVWNAELSVLLQDDQEMLLKASGFRKVNFYGAFDFSPYDKKNSDLLITVANK